MRFSNIAYSGDNILYRARGNDKRELKKCNKERSLHLLHLKKKGKKKKAKKEKKKAQYAIKRQMRLERKR